MKAILLSLWVFASTSAQATSIQGVDFAPQIEVQGQPLVLDGAGLLRWKGIFKVYVAGLYREQPEQDFSFDSVESQTLEIAYLRDIPAEGFIKATRLGLEKTLPNDETLAQWQPDLDGFLNAYQSVQKGDRYRLSVTQSEFSLSLNGSQVYQSENSALGRRLLGVWLDERSPSPSLREDLLAMN